MIPDDGEGPARSKTLKPFRMSATTVTNAIFDQFVAKTGYMTDAERYGWSFVFFSDVSDAILQTQSVVGIEWWHKVDGANW